MVNGITVTLKRVSSKRLHDYNSQQIYETKITEYNEYTQYEYDDSDETKYSKDARALHGDDVRSGECLGTECIRDYW